MNTPIFQIDNLCITINGGYRGCSLSSKRNNWALSKFYDAGVRSIIDLRTKDHTDRFQFQCEALGFTYHHFPIDSKNTSSEKIAYYLPKLISVIDEGNFYIACAMGLHRTDIALSLYYLFHPNPDAPIPELIGHKLEGGILKVEDIFRRSNSVFKIIGTESCKSEYEARKRKLQTINDRW